MAPHRIQTQADVAALGELPYAQFMPHTHVYDALRAAALRHADRPAITYVREPDPAQPVQTWTYAELLARIHRTANLFAALVPPDAEGRGPRVAMLLPNIPEAHLTLWGGETAGVVCPINYLLEPAHIAELVQTSGCQILVALGPHPELDIWSKASAVARECPGLQHVFAVGGAPGARDFMTAVDAMPGDALAPAITTGADRVAALFHTGGTTGAPKLAQHRHSNQLHSSWCAAQFYAMDERDTLLNGFPLFHVAGAFVYGLSVLLSGAQIVLPTLLGLRNTTFMQRYWDFVEQHRVSLLAAVPTVMGTLLKLEPGQASRGSVRALLTGGSPLPNELAQAFERRYGIAVRNILGMTECAGVVSIEPFLGPRTPGSCGLPLPYTEVVAVNAEGQRCAPGESGIVRLRGPNVGPGYTDARRNTGTFDDQGWLITGDIGHIDAEGRVFITGRAKDVIIRSGHNIDPQQIEEALLQHPDVMVAAAVGEPDEYAGEVAVVYVSVRPGASVTPEELSAFANARIPERPAYPKRVQIVPSVPLTAVGKVFKPRLRAMACETALGERLARAGLADAFEIRVADASSGLQVLFAARSAEAAAQHAEAVRAIMAPFPLAYRVAVQGEES